MDNVYDITTTSSSKIFGRHTAPQGGGVNGRNTMDEISLEDFVTLDDPVMIDYQGNVLGDFQHYTWISAEDVKKSKVWQENFPQPAVKNKDRFEKSTKKLIQSFQTKGLVTTEYPPSIYHDEYGELKIFDGRTYTKAWLSEDNRDGVTKGICGEFLPVAVFNLRAGVTPDQLDAGSRSENNRLPHEPQHSEDFIAAGLVAISRGTLERRPTAIASWVNDVSGVWTFTVDKGTITAICSQIFIQSDPEYGDVLSVYNTSDQDRKRWFKMVIAMNGPNYKKGFKIVNVGDGRSSRELESMFLEGSEKDPVRVVLYHNNLSSGEGRELIKAYHDGLMKNIEKAMYRQKVLYGHDFKEPGLPDSPVLLKILGALPSTADHEEYYNEGKLVPIDEY